MIHKIKKRFILLSMLPLLLVLVMLVMAMNIVNHSAFVKDADRTLSAILYEKSLFKHDGQADPLSDSPEDGQHHDIIDDILHEARFFTVTLSADKEVLHVNTARISSVNDTQAVQYAKSVVSREAEGFFGTSFRYMYAYDGDNLRIAFLDCKHQIETASTFFVSSVAVSALGYFVVFLVVVILADRIIKPFSDNYEKQKQFITDAGHEIKTPLTIISANVDLMEMEHGENEYIDEIKAQISSMKSLTASLVYLAKTEESDSTVKKLKIPVSDIAEETVSSFAAPAQLAGLEIVEEIKPMLSVRGDDKSIRTLISILLDNAVKYATEGTRITVSLTRRGKNVILAVKNKTDEELDREKLEMLFERFWRNDASRNSSTGGHGIGLSIARAIAEKHGGRITAQSANGSVIITATLPING